MNTGMSSIIKKAGLSSVLGLVAVGLVISYLIGWNLPLVANDRAALYTLAVLGFAMCCIGMGRTAAQLGWTHPITVSGVVMGVLIIVIVAATAAGWPLPLIANDRAAMLTVAMMGLAKWGLGLVNRLFLQT
jgi:hypothetical protein